MAEPNPSPNDADDQPDSLATFDTGAETEDTEPETGSEGGAGRARYRRTLIGLALAVAVSATTVFVARSILIDTGIDVGVGQTVAVGLVALVVAVAAFIPLRWGLWVVPLVAGAHYALNFYNMLFTDQSVYQFVEGSAMGYAALTPAIGVALGWLLEGLYRLIAPE